MQGVCFGVRTEELSSVFFRALRGRVQRGAFAIPILNYLIISKTGYRNFLVAPLFSAFGAKAEGKRGGFDSPYLACRLGRR